MKFQKISFLELGSWMNKIVVCENIRSSYNIGNIIRTADALGFDVLLSGYSPLDEKVFKTSLGAEKRVKIIQSWNSFEALKIAQSYGKIICAEITSSSKDLKTIEKNIGGFVVGNEVSGVLPQSLEFFSDHYHIPMAGEKESLNVGQAAAIFMWQLNL